MASYDPITDTIKNCTPYTFVWFHEEGHRNQFKHEWVRKTDRMLWASHLYGIWNFLLEIDATLYAIVKWSVYKCRHLYTKLFDNDNEYQ